MILKRFLEIFRSGFLEVSGWKKRLLQLSILLAVVGGIAHGASFFSETGEGGLGTWSWSALTSGIGCLFGFALGAAFRIFLKLSLLVGGVVALVLFGLTGIGWIDLPWESLSEINAAVGAWISDATRNMQAALTSYLPASTMSGLGLFSGVTQKPDMDLDN